MRKKMGIDYSTFGAPMPGRNASSSDYPMGFNGQRKDDEITGSSGTDYDFGARMYDARVGRFFSVDPMTTAYAHLSPYLFAENNPIYFIDDEGKNAVATVDGNTITVSAVIQITGDGATDAKAAEMQAQIMGYYGPRTYTDESGTVYNVKFDIKVVTTVAPNQNMDEYNLARLVSPEHAKALPADRRQPDGHLRSSVNPTKEAGFYWYGQWDMNESAAGYAHETGHLLGYSDRYYEFTYVDNNITRMSNVQGLSGSDNYSNTASNELMGLAASDPSIKAAITQKDIDALASYVLANKNATGTVNLSYPTAKLNEPTPEEKMKVNDGLKIIKPASSAPPKAGPKEGHGDVRVFD